MQWALVHIGVDLGVFEDLSSVSGPLTLQHFLEKTGAAKTLLTHLLRSMASFGFISETDRDMFSANKVTHALAKPDVAGSVDHVTDFHALTAQVLPRYLREHNYQNMSDPKDLPFHKALNTDLAPFEYMKQNPAQMKSMGHAMRVERLNTWVDSYPVEDEARNFRATDDTALLVDIGGGFGQQAVAFKTKFDSLQGRIVVQDIASTLAHAPAAEGLEFQEHDFFKPQPIKGAKYYYLRHILHDWNDEDSIRILQNLVPAMAPESRIMIDEVFLPDSKVPWQCAFMDLTMTSSLGGCERSKEEWTSLLDRAGLRIVGVHTYDGVRMNSIITAVPK
jgi:demethylsterigmatocystin 6-O-methyltransferase